VGGPEIKQWTGWEAKSVRPKGMKLKGPKKWK